MPFFLHFRLHLRSGVAHIIILSRNFLVIITPFSVSVDSPHPNHILISILVLILISIVLIIHIPSALLYEWSIVRSEVKRRWECVRAF